MGIKLAGEDTVGWVLFRCEGVTKKLTLAFIISIKTVNCIV